MKKTYINPEMEIVNVQIHSQLLRISGGTDNKNAGSNGDYTNEVNIGARQGWFDDSDDE